MENSSMSVSNAANIQQTAGDLNNERDKMDDKVSFIQRKQEMMLAHVTNLAESRNTWISRLTLPKDQKNLLREHAEKQREGLSIVLSNQNKSLAAICGAQTAYMKELANMITVVAGTRMKGTAYKMFNDMREEMDVDIAIKERNFFRSIEEKLVLAERSSPLVQASLMQLIQNTMRRFENDMKTQQDRFSSVLNDLV